MQRKINDTVICLRMGKNLTVKIPPSDFQVTTPETPLLSQQVVTSKESQIPYQPTVELLLQYPMDLFCSDSFPFWCTAPKYVTNGWADPNTRLQNTNLKRLLVAKFFSSSTRWRSRKCLVTKPYGTNTQQLLQEKEMN